MYLLLILFCSSVFSFPHFTPNISDTDLPKRNASLVHPTLNSPRRFLLKTRNPTNTNSSKSNLYLSDRYPSTSTEPSSDALLLQNASAATSMSVNSTTMQFHDAKFLHPYSMLLKPCLGDCHWGQVAIDPRRSSFGFYYQKVLPMEPGLQVDRAWFPGWTGWLGESR